MTYLKNQFSTKHIIPPSNWARDSLVFPNGAALSANAERLVITAGMEYEGKDCFVATYALAGEVYSLVNLIASMGPVPEGLSISGNGLVLALGIPSSLDYAGSVEVYDWSGTTWVIRGSALTASDTVSDDAFGSSVWLSEDGLHLFIGAPNWEGTSTNQGGVYEYFYNGSAWAQVGSVITTATASGFLGGSVSLSADRTIMAIGAPAHSTNRGRVQIFAYNGSSWALRNTITAADGASSDYFGSGVALNRAGTTVYIGARGWEGVDSNQGGVYTYTYAASVWTAFGSVIVSPVLLDKTTRANNYYGRVVVASADYSKILIGAAGGISALPFLAIGNMYSYEISGTVVDDTNAPVQRTITAHLESTGECVNSVVSSVDGTYTIAVPKVGKYFLVCQDDSSGTAYNALVLSGIEVV